MSDHSSMHIVDREFSTSTCQLERLEERRLASASYVTVGVKVQPVITGHVTAYFAKGLPAGDYLVAVVGGSMTYRNNLAHIKYRVNDYDQGDFGFKIVQPHEAPINAPGLSNAVSNSAAAATASVGLFVKFRHSFDGKIGIVMLDDPYNDNAPGSVGSPVFVLKKRVVTATPAIASPAALTASPMFSTTSISHSIASIDGSDKLDQLT
ncbi:MAG: hypothetical protein JO353_02300 [Phycisphaerae bacterium]|nr:hypothetical protein [Phycisphaerae bacterium]